MITWSDGGAGGKFASGTCTLTAVSLTTNQSKCSVVYTAPSLARTVTITAIYSGDGTHKTSSGTSALIVS